MFAATITFDRTGAKASTPSSWPSTTDANAAMASSSACPGGFLGTMRRSYAWGAGRTYCLSSPPNVLPTKSGVPLRKLWTSIMRLPAG